MKRIFLIVIFDLIGVSLILVGCATGGTHTEGYYIVDNANTNRRICCTPNGVTAAKKAMAEHNEGAARAILFHTNPDWRDMGWVMMHGTKYYVYSSHLNQGGSDEQMATLWEEFNRAFGYRSIPWLADKIAKQQQDAKKYWEGSLRQSQATQSEAETGSAASIQNSNAAIAQSLQDAAAANRAAAGAPHGGGGTVGTGTTDYCGGYGSQDLKCGNR